MSIEERILSTLTYSDIFDFPLTLNEIHKFLITNRKISKKTIKSVLGSSKEIRKKGIFYFLQERERIVGLRINREKESNNKITKNIGLIKILGYIPTIRLIAISGSVSVGNAKKNDDLDLFVICRKNTIWFSRFLILSILFLFNKKRKFRGKKIRDKICVNMFLDEGSILIEEHNLFIAKEISQILPVINKEKIYERFISKNQWIIEYMANYNMPEISHKKARINKVMNFVDNIFYFLEKKYMSKKITSEKIDKNFAWFHPRDNSKVVLNKYFIRLDFEKPA